MHHAQRAARRARQLLASGGVTADVIPVLVLWGPGAPRIEGGYRRIGDVRVLIGAQSKDWRARLKTNTGAPLREARDAIETYTRRLEMAQAAPRHRRLPPVRDRRPRNSPAG